MELSQIMNSPGLWVASSFMVIAAVGMAVIFFKLGVDEAKRMGMPKSRYMAAVRSSAISSVGPSISPVVVLVSMIAVVGGPTTWMRLCDVGAARTELGVISLASGLVGAEPGTASFGIDAFALSLWGMALNNFGWLFVTLVLTHRMDKVVDQLYAKYDPAWIKVLLASCSTGMFAYLITNQVVPALFVTDKATKITSFVISAKTMPKVVAAIIGAGVMIFLNKAFKKNKRIQELSLGIALICGMAITQIIFG